MSIDIDSSKEEKLRRISEIDDRLQEIKEEVKEIAKDKCDFLVPVSHNLLTGLDSRWENADGAREAYLAAGDLRDEYHELQDERNDIVDLLIYEYGWEPDFPYEFESEEDEEEPEQAKLC